MSNSITDLYESLSAKIGKEEAKGLLNFITEHEEKSEVATKGFVKKEIAESKNALILWMFGFWVGQVAIVIGIVMYILSLKK